MHVSDKIIAAMHLPLRNSEMGDMRRFDINQIVIRSGEIVSKLDEEFEVSVNLPPLQFVACAIIYRKFVNLK